MTRSEASALAGTAFGAGKEETVQHGARRCVYGGQTLNVFTVETAKAKDAATAQAQWASTKAQVDAAVQGALPAGVQLQAADTDVQGLGDKAAAVAASTSIQGRKIALSGVYVLQGPTFFAFQDLVLGKPAPTTAAMKAQAATSLARVS